MFLNNSYTDLGITDDSNIVEVGYQLINDFLILPNKTIQSRILLAFAISNTSFLTKLPNLLCYGKSGSGKSTILKVICALHGLDYSAIKTSSSTPVSIRNYLQKQKNEALENGLEEPNTCILLDDINPSILANDYLLSILKSGYDKRTATIEISGGQGNNLRFNCFSKYCYGSIHPLWTYLEFQELIRRWLILGTCPYQELSDKDKEDNKEPLDLDEIDYYDFNGFNGLVNFWTEDRIMELEVSFKKVKKLIKSSQIDPQIAVVNLQLLSVLGLLDSPSEAIATFEKFLGLQSVLLADANPLETFLKTIFLPKHDNLFLLDELHEIESEELKLAIAKSEITDNINNKTIKETMLKLGYKQAKSRFKNKLVWVKL